MCGLWFVYEWCEGCVGVCRGRRPERGPVYVVLREAIQVPLRPPSQSPLLTIAIPTHTTTEQRCAETAPAVCVRVLFSSSTNHSIPPSMHQVWDFSASADARDTEGGASKRSLLEQVEKMRGYLAAEGQQC